MKSTIPPQSYILRGEGGAADSAKGSAKIRLEEDNGATVLRYDFHADFGGQLAQIEAPLLTDSVKTLADQFFEDFGALLVPPAPAATSPQLSWLPWVAAAVAVGLVLLYALS